MPNEESERVLSLTEGLTDHERRIQRIEEQVARAVPPREIPVEGKVPLEAWVLPETREHILEVAELSEVPPELVAGQVLDEVERKTTPETQSKKPRYG